MSNYAFFGAAILLQLGQMVMQILESDTGLMLEIEWTILALAPPVISILYLTHPDAMLEVMLSANWAVWILDAVYAAFIFINWDFLYGSTAKSFRIKSGNTTLNMTTANGVISSLSLVLITVFNYIAALDYSVYEEETI